MKTKLQVTINVIIHATEDTSKFMGSFEEIFDFNQDKIMIQNLTGHFDNPITMINVKLIKKEAQEFLDRLTRLLSDTQINEIIEDLENRTDNSTLYIRLNKQSFIKGKIEFREKDAIKIKISTPIYNKKEKSQIFTKILQTAN